MKEKREKSKKKREREVCRSEKLGGEKEKGSVFVVFSAESVTTSVLGPLTQYFVMQHPA